MRRSKNSFNREYQRSTIDTSGMFWYADLMLKATSICLDAADMKKLERIAKKENLKASYLVRKAIKEFLERSK